MVSYFTASAIIFAVFQISTAQFSLRCTFENDDCPSLSQSDADDHDFLYHSGSTLSAGTGPRAEDSSRYAYLEASGKRLDSKARLSTGLLGFTGDVCVKFEYSMYGNTINMLSVLLVENGKADQTLWTKSGSQSNLWVQSTGDYTVTSMNQMIVFEALVGSTFSSDIALDNIEIYSGTCSTGSATGGTPRASRTTSSGSGGTTASPTAYPMIWRCDFDSDYNDACQVTQVSNSLDWNWLRQSGPTPSSDTGPPESYDGSYYYYMEGSGTSLVPGSKTAFTSPVMRPSGKMLCLKIDFYYYMFGRSVGTLEVRATGQNFDDQVVFYNGPQGDQWFKSSTEVDVPTNAVTFQFIATRGDGFRSDIAVDRIKVYDCSSEQTQGGGTTSLPGTPIPTEKPTTVNSGSSTTTAPNAGADNVSINPTYVFIEEAPGSVVCKVMNTASLPYTWNGFKWYDPSGNYIGLDNPSAIVDTVYHAIPTASGEHFWTSTLYVDSLDYTQNGKYVCEVSYQSDVTRISSLVDVKGCPADYFTCKTGGGCVPCGLLCDGLNDCGDMSDELSCGTDDGPRSKSDCAQS